MAPATVDAAAKQFEAPPGKARVYMVRPSGVGSAITFHVNVDDRRVALLPVHTYVIADVDPGAHTFVAGGQENEASVTLNVEAGRSYFLRIGPRPGWLFARTAIYEVSEVQGREAVAKASLVKGY